MRFFEALFYPFQERDWPSRLGMAVLVAAIPVVGFFIIKGWEYEISARVRHNTPNKLPPWRNIWIKLVRGVIIRFVGFLYNIPTYLLFGIGIWLWVQTFVTFFKSDQQTWQAFVELYSRGIPLRLSLLLLGLLYLILGNMLYWSGYLRYIETGDLWDFFDLITNIKLTIANVWDDFLMGIYMGILGMILGAVGTALIGALSVTGVGAFLAPIFVPALTFTVLTWVDGHFFGQLANRTLG